MSLFAFIKSNLSILDVVSEYVPLKQAGNYWKGSCPLHSETDASFTVSPDKQIFYCFGCHASGDVISFIEQIEHISPRESIRFLIDRYHITVPQDIAQASSLAQTKHTERDVYFRLCKAVAQWAQKQFHQTPAAYNYIQQRGITKEIVSQFNIGYFPGGTLALNKFIKEMGQTNVLAKDLFEYALLIEGRSMYSPFEERILFPIKDASGNFCGFGGRVFRPNDERPKYYNSKESEGFIKGKLLFGLDFAKKSIQEKKHAFLVEGYIDCIVMTQYGYTNTVATLGTACTIEHLKLIARMCPTLYVLYDGDKAGQNAMLRLTQLCWEANLDLKIIQLPPAHDPASLLTSNQKLDDFIVHAQDIFAFFIATQTKDFSTKPLAEKIDIIEKIVKLICRSNNDIKQELLLQQASQSTNIELQTLKNAMTKQQPIKIPKTPIKTYVKNNPFDIALFDISLLEEKIFSAIINSLDDCVQPFTIDVSIVPYFSEHIQNFINKVNTFSTINAPTPKSCSFSMFIATLSDSEKKWAIEVSMKHSKCSKEMFELFMLRFCKHHWKYIVLHLKKEMVQAKMNNNDTLYNELLGKFLTIKSGLVLRGLI